MFARRGDVMQAWHAPPTQLAAAGKKLQDFTFCEGESLKKSAMFNLKGEITVCNTWNVL